MKTIDIPPTTSLDDACELAAATVRETGEPVCFEFNGVVVEVHEGNTADWAMQQWYNGVRQKREEAARRFHADLRSAVTAALGNTTAAGDRTAIDNMLAAITPFLREP